jgi:hypothetical protein
MDDFDLTNSGEYLAKSPYVASVPRRWTDDEVQWIVDGAANGLTIAEMAEKLQRTEVSVFVKLKRLSKKADSYNTKFRDLKYETNLRFGMQLQPSSVLDLFAGNSWWKRNGFNTVSNDVSREFETDHNEKAFDLLCRLQLSRTSFDVVDLDPFGSAYECFDLAFRMAKKGVVISFGEWGHKRWRRTDFVSSRYGIDRHDDFVAERFIAEGQRFARMHKKHAEVFEVLQYSNFLRVYFVLDKFKETSQWK